MVESINMSIFVEEVACSYLYRLTPGVLEVFDAIKAWRRNHLRSSVHS